MQVQVSGKHVDVGEALRTRIADEILSSIGRYFERGGDAEVVVAREGFGFRVDCTVLLASGQSLQAHGLGVDAQGAASQAIAKAEKQIRRYKRRLKSHAIAAETKAAEQASSYVLRAPADETEEADWENEAGHGPPAAMVIAESESELRTMTVSMAVLDLDLSDQPVIVFRNAAHGGLSVVFRRADGNIGWIDPQRTGAGEGQTVDGQATGPGRRAAAQAEGNRAP